VFGAHLPKVVAVVAAAVAAAVDLLLIMDHIKGRIVVEVDEDTSFFPSFFSHQDPTKGL
jgi:pseudouridine-5'-phosphate glycosidase